MRILIGTVEICGWTKTISDELKRQGHSVITIADANRYYPDYKYDISNANFVRDYINFRTQKNAFLRYGFLSLHSFINKTIKGAFSQKVNNYIRKKANIYFFKNTDVFIYFWNGLSTDDSDIAEFKKNGVKVITWFVGDDVRYYPEMRKQFGIINNFYEGYFKKSFHDLLKKLRIHEKYADLIYSVPDQATLALRPYYHLQIPVQLNKFEFKITGNEIPVVVHIPSSPQIKGTVFIRQAIDDLKKEGLPFVYKELINIPNTEVLKELSNADILVDELFLHGPGVLSFEAMASGCAVATRYIESSPGVFLPPVVAIDEQNIKDKIRELIANNELRSSLIQKGRDYVANNNTVQHIVSQMMTALSTENKPDYYPDYFRNKFVAEHADIQFINQQTELIKEESWYKKAVPEGIRNDLKF